MPIIQTHSGQFTAEASDIGFMVGMWPISFVYNEMTFHRRDFVRDREGDVMYVTYATRDGRNTIQVFND